MSLGVFQTLSMIKIHPRSLILEDLQLIQRTPPRMNCWRSSRKPKGHRQGETHGDPPHFLMDDLAISPKNMARICKNRDIPYFQSNPRTGSIISHV